MYSTRLWMCPAMIYPAGPGAYDTGEFVELPQAHLNRPRADLFRHGCAVAVVPALAFRPPLPRFGKT